MSGELTDSQWQDLQARRPGDGFYAVRTTGIHCRTGCPARTPLRANVQWFQTSAEAVAAGFRACKRCKPDQDILLDCIGLLCPLPVLKARKALASMAEGATLTVMTTDRMALIDLPHFCAEAGHVYLGTTETDGQARHVIRAGPRRVTVPDAESRSPGNGP